MQKFLHHCIFLEIPKQTKDAILAIVIPIVSVTAAIILIAIIVVTCRNRMLTYWLKNKPSASAYSDIELKGDIVAEDTGTNHQITDEKKLDSSGMFPNGCDNKVAA